MKRRTYGRPSPYGKEPTFIVWAVKDPDDGNPTAFKFIKGWTKSGQISEKSRLAWSGNRKPDPVTSKSWLSATRLTKNATYVPASRRAQESVAGSGV